MTNVKIVPTDAVASPVVVDVTGPAADADAIVRFLASPSFNDALVTVAKAACEPFAADLTAWCEDQGGKRFVDVFDGYDTEKAKGFAEAMTAVVAHVGASK